MHLVITGLRLHGPHTAPLFWFRTLPAFSQARAAPDCAFAEARTIAGVHHTLTAWADAAAAHNYMTSGAHGRAMKAFNRIGTGHVVRWEGDALPDWADAHRRWLVAAPDAA